MDVGRPAGPSFFLFSSPEQGAKALRAAGFDAPTFRQVRQDWRDSDPDQLFAMMAKATVRAAAILRGQSSQARQAIREHVREAICAHRRGDDYEVPMPAVIAAAVKPRS